MNSFQTGQLGNRCIQTGINSQIVSSGNWGQGWLWKMKMLFRWRSSWKVKLSKWRRFVSDVKPANIKVNTASTDCDAFTHWPAGLCFFLAKEAFVSLSREGRPYLAFVSLIPLPVMFARLWLGWSADGELRRWNANINSLKFPGLSLRFRMDANIYDMNGIVLQAPFVPFLPSPYFDKRNCGSTPPAGQRRNTTRVRDQWWWIVELFRICCHFFRSVRNTVSIYSCCWKEIGFKDDKYSSRRVTVHQVCDSGHVASVPVNCLCFLWNGRDSRHSTEGFYYFFSKCLCKVAVNKRILLPCCHFCALARLCTSYVLRVAIWLCKVGLFSSEVSMHFTSI